jgi:hypothetical protein
LTELTFQVAIRTDPHGTGTSDGGPSPQPGGRLEGSSNRARRALLEPLHLRILLPGLLPCSETTERRPTIGRTKCDRPPSAAADAARDDTGSPAHLGAECPLPVKASVHGEALRALASDETQSSAPMTNSRLLSAEGQVCPRTTYVRASQTTRRTSASPRRSHRWDELREECLDALVEFVAD